MEGRLDRLEAKLDAMSNKMDQLNNLITLLLEEKSNKVKKADTKLINEKLPLISKDGFALFEDPEFVQVIAQFLRDQGPKDVSVIRFAFIKLISDSLLQHYIWPSEKAHNKSQTKEMLPPHFTSFMQEFLKETLVEQKFEAIEARVRRWINGTKARIGRREEAEKKKEKTQTLRDDDEFENMNLD